MEDNINFNIDEIFSFLSDPQAGLEKWLGAILSMSDERFDIIRPALEDAVVQAYSTPQAQMQLITLTAQSGLSISDVIENIDLVIEQLDTKDLEISDSKKDFLKFIFVTIDNAIANSTLNPAHLITIPIELCRENAKLPTYSTLTAAAMDIYSPEEYVINPGESVIIPIGIKVNIPHGYALLIQPRSGLSARSKVRIPNTPGLIDEDYHEEIGVIIENTDLPVKDVDIYEPSDHLELVKLHGGAIVIGKGERFAQMRLVEVPRVKWQEVSSIGNFDNDHGKGFGSTGVE